MKRAFSMAVLAALPIGTAAAAPSTYGEPANPPAASGGEPVLLAQFGGGYPAAPVLREFVDPNGNRVFVDPYGNVVSVVPPAEPQPGWGQGGGQDWGGRRQGDVLEGRVYPPPPPPADPYGEYQPYEGEPRPREYRQYGAPAPSYDPSYPAPPERSVERRALEAPDPRDWQQEGPQPYTPPDGLDAGAESDFASSGPEGTPEVAALQILLDRAGMSPGVIDGRMGSNVRKALVAFEAKTGETLDPDDTEAIMENLRNTGGLPISQYTITEDDVDGPFIESVPTDYAEKAELEALSYTSPVELLAERFHMDEDYLRSINPNADFSAPGTVIKVADTASNEKGSVARIVADKAQKQVRAYDAEGKLIAAYPATIGSRSTPSPSGTHTVERIAPDPNYTYNPEINFKQGDNDEILTIPPGPNGPVGSMWIALSKPTYGIHGTPEPAKIGKTESNGCIRLTNWDADELAGMVEPGVVVEFLGGGAEMLVSERENDAGALPQAATLPELGTAPGSAVMPLGEPR